MQKLLDVHDRLLMIVRIGGAGHLLNRGRPIEARISSRIDEREHSRPGCSRGGADSERAVRLALNKLADMHVDRLSGDATSIRGGRRGPLNFPISAPA